MYNVTFVKWNNHLWMRHYHAICTKDINFTAVADALEWILLRNGVTDVMKGTIILPTTVFQHLHIL